MVTLWHVSATRIAVIEPSNLNAAPASPMRQPNVSVVVTTSSKIRARPHPPPYSRAFRPTLRLRPHLPRCDFLSVHRRRLQIHHAVPISDTPQPKIESYSSQRYPPRRSTATTISNPPAQYEGRCGTRIDLASHALKLRCLSHSYFGSRLGWLLASSWLAALAHC